ncbi:MAG: hypothetical protein IKJ35_00050 [Clostridia bacterium]|nr:hypothetical protein [Clostridia bacterium]
MKKRILAIVLSLCLLIGVAVWGFTRCSRPPQVEEIYDRVVALIEASNELNTVFYGAGLPVHDADSVYAEYTHMYYGFSLAGEYEIVAPQAKFLSVDEIKLAAEKVYSKGYLEDVLYPSAFDGYAVDDGSGGATIASSRYYEDGGGIYRSTNDKDYLKGDVRIYDYSTMKIVSPSNGDACTLKIDSYLLSKPDQILSDTIRLVRQDDGLWYLDSFTG